MLCVLIFICEGRSEWELLYHKAHLSMHSGPLWCHGWKQSLEEVGKACTTWVVGPGPTVLSRLRTTDFWETFHGKFIYSQSFFCLKSVERKLRKEYFLIFRLVGDAWPRILTEAIFICYNKIVKLWLAMPSSTRFQ